MFALVEGAVGLVRSRRRENEAKDFGYVRFLSEPSEDLEKTIKQNDGLKVVIGSTCSEKNKPSTFLLSQVDLDSRGHILRKTKDDSEVAFKGNVCGSSIDGRVVVFSNRKEERIYILDALSKDKDVVDTIPFPRLPLLRFETENFIETLVFRSPLQLWVSNDAKQIVALVELDERTGHKGSLNDASVGLLVYTAKEPSELRGSGEENLWERLVLPRENVSQNPERIKSQSTFLMKSKLAPGNKCLSVIFENDNVSFGRNGVTISHAECEWGESFITCRILRVSFYPPESSLDVKATEMICRKQSLITFDLGSSVDLSSEASLWSELNPETILCMSNSTIHTDALGVNIAGKMFIVFLSRNEGGQKKVIHLSDAFGIGGINESNDRTMNDGIRIHDLEWTSDGLFLSVCFSNGALSLITNCGELVQLRPTESFDDHHTDLLREEDSQFVEGSYSVNIPPEKIYLDHISEGRWSVCAYPGFPMLCVTNGRVLMVIKLPHSSIFKSNVLNRQDVCVLSFASVIRMLISEKQSNADIKNLGLLALHENDAIRRSLHAWNLVLSMNQHVLAINKNLAFATMRVLLRSTLGYKGDRMVVIRIVSQVLAIYRRDITENNFNNFEALIYYGRGLVFGLIQTGCYYEAAHVLRLFETFTNQFHLTSGLTFDRQWLMLGFYAYTSPPQIAQSPADSEMLSPWTNISGDQTEYSDKYSFGEYDWNEKQLGAAIFAKSTSRATNWSAVRSKVRKFNRKRSFSSFSAERKDLSNVISSEDEDSLIPGHMLYLSEKYDDCETFYREAGNAGVMSLMCLLLRRYNIKKAAKLALKHLNDCEIPIVKFAVQVLCDIMIDYFSYEDGNTAKGKFLVPSPVCYRSPNGSNVKELMPSLLRKYSVAVPEWTVDFAAELTGYLSPGKLFHFLNNVVDFAGILPVLKHDLKNRQILSDYERFVLYRRYLNMAWSTSDDQSEKRMLEFLCSEVEGSVLVKCNVLWVLLNYVRLNLTEVLQTSRGEGDGIKMDDFMFELKSALERNMIYESKETRIISLFEACISLARSCICAHSSDTLSCREFFFTGKSQHSGPAHTQDQFTTFDACINAVRGLSLCIWMVNVFLENVQEGVLSSEIMVVCMISASAKSCFQRIAIDAAEESVFSANVTERKTSNTPMPGSYRIAAQHLLNPYIGWEIPDGICRSESSSVLKEEAKLLQKRKLLVETFEKIMKESPEEFCLPFSSCEFSEEYNYCWSQIEYWFHNCFKQSLCLFEAGLHEMPPGLLQSQNLILMLLESTQREDHSNKRKSASVPWSKSLVLDRPGYFLDGVELIFPEEKMGNVKSETEYDPNAVVESVETMSDHESYASTSDHLFSDGNGSEVTSIDENDISVQSGRMFHRGSSPSPVWFIGEVDKLEENSLLSIGSDQSVLSPPRISSSKPKTENHHGKNYVDLNAVNDHSDNVSIPNNDAIQKLNLIQSQNETILLRMENLMSKHTISNNAGNNDRSVSLEESSISDIEYSSSDEEGVQPFSHAVRSFQTNIALFAKTTSGKSVHMRDDSPVRKEMTETSISSEYDNDEVKERIYDPDIGLDKPSITLLQLPITQKHIHEKHAVDIIGRKRVFKSQKFKSVFTETKRDLTSMGTNTENILTEVISEEVPQISQKSEHKNTINSTLCSNETAQKRMNKDDTSTDQQDSAQETSIEVKNLSNNKEVLSGSDLNTQQNVNNGFVHKTLEGEKETGTESGSKLPIFLKEEPVEATNGVYLKNPALEKENHNRLNLDANAFKRQVVTLGKESKQRNMTEQPTVVPVKPCFASPLIYLNIDNDASDEEKLRSGRGISKFTKKFIHVAELSENDI